MSADVERRTVRDVSWRILPFLFVLYVFSFLDRSNVSIAALQMNEELHFSSAVFGFGAGLFSAGYALFEIPSNFVLTRVGARRWIARIAVSWGVLATAMALIHTPAQFYFVRFLLGVAEAGFFPGVIYYIAQWYPLAYRARAAAIFTVAIPVSQVFGGALGGVLLGLGGAADLSGWRWLFLLEGVPSLVLGIMVWFHLTDSPGEAHWLAAVDRDWLVARLRQDREASAPTSVGPAATAAAGIGYWRALQTPVCWWLALMYFSFLTIGVGYTSWIALLVRGALATQNTITGFITGGISLVSVGSYLVAARLSDRTNDRCLYAVIGLAFCTVGCLGAAFAPLPWLKVLSLAMIPLGTGVFLPSFWCLPTLTFSGPSAASAIALISAVGSSGGLLGPSIIGYLKHSTGGDAAAFVALAGVGLVGCSVGVVLMREDTFAPR
ncbi:MAG: major facilitator superfamily 1 [Gammaproteobacteria bacterium]|nr:major facilitator superfamily 1 [Gammaproteobacteria bacterium]